MYGYEGKRCFHFSDSQRPGIALYIEKHISIGKMIQKKINKNGEQRERETEQEQERAGRILLHHIKSIDLPMENVSRHFCIAKQILL